MNNTHQLTRKESSRWNDAEEQGKNAFFSEKLTFDESVRLLEETEKQQNRERGLTNQKCNVHSLRKQHQQQQQPRHKFAVFCLTCYRETTTNKSTTQNNENAAVFNTDTFVASEWI